ncbi:YgfZ/GcvT domain-containing protein [Ottowia testudinis]|uniref:Folate-binding protein YgfZ n=1 Tax=Ottowia testudinis TaxID=2816950 RepID=A0A975CJ67_9BURK|nr:folate-binding protein YgfZ [Ottowia testudinis]QTD47155.1 folate-binding protein YgfZ [Ottowia testudinis]
MHDLAPDRRQPERHRPLPHLGVIRAQGEDAAKFLQGQLTQDVALMKPGESRLAAFCNAKGRMLASFEVLKVSADEFLLVTSAGTLAATLKRLSMFVLRAKCRLSDATADVALAGLLGDAAISIAARARPSSASGHFDHEFTIPLPAADGTPRALWLAPAGTPLPPTAPVSEADWLLAEVRAGVARITQPVAEAFVPQMLNYESVGGINFKKGCYPGQEVVARSQFRGAIKRRAFVGQVAGAAQAGQEVFDAAAPDQPVGLIAQAAAAPGGGTAVIASLQLSALADQPALHIGAPDGPALTALHQPYPLLEDI